MDRSVTQLFATNPTILAAVNILALVGGALLAIKALTWLWRFTASAYRTSIKVAFERSRERARQKALECSEDLFLLVSRLTARLSLVIITCTATIIALVTPTMPPSMHAPFTVEQMTSLSVIFGYMYMAMVTYAVWRVLSLSMAVIGIRLDLRKKNEVGLPDA